MPYVKVIVANPRLPHQIVLGTKKGTHAITVSCNCMPRQQGWPVPLATFEGAVTAPELMRAWLISDKHRTHQAPFDAEAVAQARRGVYYRLT